MFMIYDVVVIGAGQAGLSMGYYLMQTSLTFIILDNHSEIGQVWRKRYDSLVLFTPRAYSSLPGLGLEGDPTGFPTKDEIADYLERYAKTFDLPIHLNCHVQKVQKENDSFIIFTGNSIIRTKKVVVASGPFQTPNIPPFAKKLPNHVVQLHSSEYKNPSQLNEGSVLVVGGGNSGAQIAVEVSKYYETYLSIGSKVRFLPLSLAGKSVFWWFDKLGMLHADRDSWIGKKVQNQSDLIFGYELKEKIKNRAVKLKSRTKSIVQNEIEFEDLSTIRVENVIWATGFIRDYSWIDVKNLAGATVDVKHHRGITEIDGLYFLGLPWQHRRGSALLLGVGEDAAYIAKSLLSMKKL
ncbi:NAD(P)/FAD-dependent oxidoreductase [Paenibacillus sp. BSR1-1]|uniref:flavin-containing monooxygenase n=1 Tax=Paenibacillus sp. BSR1-1 TaxID=3020845 RepID=UPI0025AEF2C4|nr:NAD(P)/FAD-dependent oxidoreductase [Paenibacillus sp. BSR1-1]MDN3020233.1 NAD(P)/FAD-dependent oxidoreductase [Paenibacillus sp. BSR1-1]